MVITRSSEQFYEIQLSLDSDLIDKDDDLR